VTVTFQYCDSGGGRCVRWRRGFSRASAWRAATFLLTTICIVREPTARLTMVMPNPHFLRGFNLDRVKDFATYVDDVP
jgi:hypothetical protein